MLASLEGGRRRERGRMERGGRRGEGGGRREQRGRKESPSLEGGGGGREGGWRGGRREEGGGGRSEGGRSHLPFRGGEEGEREDGGREEGGVAREEGGREEGGGIRSYLPLRCRALAREIQYDFSRETDVRASNDFCTISRPNIRVVLSLRMTYLQSW